MSLFFHKDKHCHKSIVSIKFSQLKDIIFQLYGSNAFFHKKNFVFKWKRNTLEPTRKLLGRTLAWSFANTITEKTIHYCLYYLSGFTPNYWVSEQSIDTLHSDCVMSFICSILSCQRLLYYQLHSNIMFFWRTALILKHGPPMCDTCRFIDII